ncbi:Pentatricopeptide repeat [Dillenia turbinata]|uniref:Pentatricopeptide repeat n=1 Tax=Dillenia turbinata TaxID=194707 RepID=A0AAN8VZ82_9MAGN
MVSGYARFGDLVSARSIFEAIPEKNVVSWTTIIDGYAKAGDLASARFLFEQSPGKDVVMWSALISGYAQNGQPHEAVNVFLEMRERNIRSDEFILVSLMSACSQIGSLELAKWVDEYVSQMSTDLRQAHVVAALIDMNAKCGNMDRAMSLFDDLPNHDLISYCSLIQGLSIHGLGAQAVCLFERMLGEGLTPDNVAFSVILIACSRAGLIDEGCHYFDSMINKYSIVPSPDHYACMVDLLGRAGRLDTAYQLIRLMPIEPNIGAWGALLGACRLHGNIELGEEVSKCLYELEPLNADKLRHMEETLAKQGATIQRRRIQ